MYKDLTFPPEVYEHISGYYEGKAESSRSHIIGASFLNPAEAAPAGRMELDWREPSFNRKFLGLPVPET